MGIKLKKELIKSIKTIMLNIFLKDSFFIITPYLNSNINCFTTNYNIIYNLEYVNI